MLTPVDNPSAYGLVETAPDGAVRRFLEKPKADEITCDTINAGIYVLEPDTFDRIPKDVAYSIERAYFPSLVERGEPFVAYIDHGYWIDIGTPEKYVQVHRDMFDGHFNGGLFATADRSKPIVAPDARIEEAAALEPPCFVDSGAHDQGRRGRRPIRGDRQGRHHRGRGAASPAASSGRTLASGSTPSGGRDHRPQLPRRPVRDAATPAVLGDKTLLTDYTRI